MARGFRYYEKKRGDRRTGSSSFGSLGEALFFAVFLLLGCGGATLMFYNFVVPDWRVNHEFVETACKVLDKRIDEKQGEDAPLYAPEIKIEYDAGGDITTWARKTYYNNRKDAQSVLDRFDLYSAESDKRYPCWYDPTDLYAVVLERGYHGWIWLAFTVPASFIVIGAGGLIHAFLHWGKSAERSAAMTRDIQEGDFFGGGERLFPFVPEGADMTNSPGTHLRFRLPIAVSPGWALFGALAFCIIWNGIVVVFAVIDVRGFLADRHDWFLTIFLIPFAAVGIGAIVVFVRQLLVATGVGPTRLEISDHPLSPGKQYRLNLAQSGRLSINTLRVSLACEESATYRQGTNTRTESREVFCQELFCREGVRIESGMPFEAEFELNMPERAMHSFKAAHNEINWSLQVEGDVVRWPNFKRSFAVIVRPLPGDGL